MEEYEEINWFNFTEDCVPDYLHYNLDILFVSTFEALQYYTLLLNYEILGDNETLIQCFYAFIILMSLDQDWL
jgi:hypothetical protein